MSFLDGLFGAPLDVAPAKLTTSATIAAGQLHLVETGTEPPGSSVVLTIKPGNNVDKAIGIKALSPASEAGSGTITVRPPGGGLIEGEGGLLMAETTMPNEAGQYREWICSRLGNWYLVGGAAGGGGGETVDEVARAAAAEAQATADALDARTSNVTNDAQLKRSAADWPGFAEKSTPVGADMLLLEDSAAGGAKKRVSVTNLVAGGGGGGGPFRLLRAEISIGAGSPSGDWAKVPFGAAPVDTHGMWDTTANRVKPNAAGYYHVNTRITLVGTGKWFLAIYKNGARALEMGIDLNQEHVSSNTGSAVIQCNGVADYFEIWLWMYGASRPYQIDSKQTYLEVFGPLA